MSEKPDWLSVTNMLVAIALAINGVVFMELRDIDNKMMLHLTNATIHIPRESVVSKDEFVMYQTMRDRQVGDIKDLICELKTIVKEQNDKSSIR